ncbi:hypothetical protein [Pseudomonas sp. FSL W5-0203]|nr:hypothetical protein [Pseudomonas sp. FSL W5-0203]
MILKEHLLPKRKFGGTHRQAQNSIEPACRSMDHMRTAKIGSSSANSHGT